MIQSISSPHHNCVDYTMTIPEKPRQNEVTKDSRQDFGDKQVSSSQSDGLVSDTPDISPTDTDVALELAPTGGSELAQAFANEHIARQFKKFNATFEEIVSKESSSTLSLFPFIRGRLSQYALLHQYDEVAILQEVYARTIDKIRQGREITNHYAWIRSVALRYIQELSRNHRRNVTIDNQLLELLAPVEGINEQFLTDEMLKIRRAFQELASEERLLLSLKTVQDLSWNEIQQIWITSGYGDLSLAALRKRKERALSHLRTLYHSL